MNCTMTKIKLMKNMYKKKNKTHLYIFNICHILDIDEGKLLRNLTNGESPVYLQVVGP